MSARAIIADGKAYQIQHSHVDDPDSWKGFGGRHFTVVFKADGEIVHTDNLFLGKSVGGTDTADIYEGWQDAAPFVRRMKWEWYENLKMSFFVAEREVRK
jgi:hypothetical protein